MTWLVIYAGIKFWLPAVTVGGLFVRAYTTIKKSVSVWADTLLDNHMTHIQLAAENAAESLQVMADTNKDLVTTMKTMRDDFQISQAENVRVQNAILTGIEVLRDRV